MADSDGDFVTLVCPPGAELAPISHGAIGYEAYRELGRSGLWLVDVPREAAAPLCRVGGFKPYRPPAAAPA